MASSVITVREDHNAEIRIAGILQFDAGEIYIDGKSVRTRPLECKRSFAYTGTVQSCGNTPKRLR